MGTREKKMVMTINEIVENVERLQRLLGPEHETDEECPAIPYCNWCHQSKPYHAAGCHWVEGTQVLKAIRAWFNRPVDAKAAWSDEQVVVILRNSGIDTECGACMEVAFTGATTNAHTCVSAAGSHAHEVSQDGSATSAADGGQDSR